MYGSVDGTFEDDYPYFLTFSKKQRSGIVNSNDFKYYHFLYSVNRKACLYDGIEPRINLSPKYTLFDCFNDYLPTF